MLGDAGQPSLRTIENGDMPGTASTRRYAQAIFQIGLEQDTLDAWLEDLGVLAGAMENREFREFLDAPQVTLNQKIAAIEEALGDSVGRLPRNLIMLLASRGIAHLFPGVLDQYERLLDGHRGVERAEVVSAVPLSDAQRERLVELLKGIVGKEIRLASRVEPGILGGVVARVGDRVIDGSTRAKLDAMRRQLVEQAG